MPTLSPYYKAVVGFVVAGLASLVTALSDNAVAPVEWATIALAAFGTLGAVYVTPNLPKGE